MSVMTASRTELPDDRPLPVEDLDLLPGDGNRKKEVRAEVTGRERFQADEPLAVRTTPAGLAGGPWNR